MKRWLTIVVLAATLGPGITGGEEAGMSAEERDRREILGHIHGIFQAFIRRDRETIRRAHAPDWVGFLGPSTRIERGIDDYMRNADASLKAFRGVGYELSDTEIRIHGDVAIVCYVARYDYVEGEGQGSTHSLPLRAIDIYERRDGAWIQVGSHITPIPSGGKWGAETESPRQAP